MAYERRPGWLGAQNQNTRGAGTDGIHALGTNRPARLANLLRHLVFRRRMGERPGRREQGSRSAGAGARHHTFFDTALAYGFGASETMLGEALRPELAARRGAVVLATKGGLRREGDRLVRDASPAWLRSGLEASLRFLGTDYVDLYQVHWPDPYTPLEETARALDAFVREGKVRYVGLSNFDLPLL